MDYSVVARCISEKPHHHHHLNSNLLSIYTNYEIQIFALHFVFLLKFKTNFEISNLQCNHTTFQFGHFSLSCASSYLFSGASVNLPSIKWSPLPHDRLYRPFQGYKQTHLSPNWHPMKHHALAKINY